MRKFHLSLAALTFGAFGLTGLYMHFVLDHLRELDLALRAFYRSRHIYILLAALLHAGLGAYIRPAINLRWLQFAGSAFVTASTLALIVAFFVESTTPNLRSPVSTLAIYSLTFGSLCHVLSGLRNQRPMD
ncbi:MAG: hypothetical protein K0U98_10910 [Deltaproteobacteria bacterium]|nr:hypothetical protein [Deltaproteobacteria bacterium]